MRSAFAEKEKSLFVPSSSSALLAFISSPQMSVKEEKRKKAARRLHSLNWQQKEVKNQEENCWPKKNRLFQRRRKVADGKRRRNKFSSFVSRYICIHVDGNSIRVHISTFLVEPPVLHMKRVKKGILLFCYGKNATNKGESGVVRNVRQCLCKQEKKRREVVNRHYVCGYILRTCQTS